MKKILIYRLGSLGDTVLALPAFHLLHETFPSAHITLLTNIPEQAKAAPLPSILENTGLYDDVLEYPLRLRDFREISRLRARIASGKFDLLISLAAPRGLLKSLRDYAFFKTCGIPRVRGIPFSSPGRLTLSTLPRNPDSSLYQWETDRILHRLRQLASLPDLREEKWWNLCLTHEESQQAGRILDHHAISTPFLVVNNGGKDPAKDWSAPNWRDLLQRLTSAFPHLGLVLIGAKNETASSGQIASAWRGPMANLCGQTSPRLSAAICRRASLFIGHDSGPMHLAAAVGTPCIGLFLAPGQPGQWFPRGGFHSIFFHRHLRWHCGQEKNLEPPRPSSYPITVDEVFEAALQFLDAPENSAQNQPPNPQPAEHHS